jgi:hypothetical protein
MCLPGISYSFFVDILHFSNQHNLKNFSVEERGMSSVCINHPTTQAITQCKGCHKPLCEECTQETDQGIFCSEQCYNHFISFNQKAKDIPVPKQNIFKRFTGLLIRLVILAVLLLIVYGLFNLVSGQPGGFFGSIRSLLGF